MIRICYAPEGEGAGGSAAAAPASAPAEAHKGTPATAPVGDAAPAASEVVKPDWLADKFWDGEAKAPRVEDLAKSYSEAERRLHMRTDDLTRTLGDEIKSGLLKDRPESADKYELVPPKGFLPEGMTFEGNKDDPLFKTASKIAFDRGLSQDDFSQLVGAYLEGLAEQMPDPNAELKALGGNAKDRVEAAKLWSEANIPKKHFPALTQITQTAAGIQLIEWMKETMGEPRQGDLSIGGTSQNDGGLTKQQLQEMMMDPRYSDPMKREDNFVKRVTDGWAALGAKGGKRR